MLYNYAFKRKSATVVCFMLISQFSQAQRWSVDDRSQTFITLAQGGVHAYPQIGYINREKPNGKRDLFYHIYLHHSIFRYYLTIDDVASRYYAFINSFITKNLTNQIDTVNLNMYAVPSGELKKTWSKPIDYNDVKDAIPIDRLNLLLAVLPFNIDGYKKPDSIVIILKNIKYVSPELKIKSSYAKLLASIIHFYALQGEKFEILILFKDGNNITNRYLFPKSRKYRKKMNYKFTAPIISE